MRSGSPAHRFHLAGNCLSRQQSAADDSGRNQRNNQAGPGPIAEIPRGRFAESQRQGQRQRQIDGGRCQTENEKPPERQPHPAAGDVAGKDHARDKPRADHRQLHIIAHERGEARIAAAEEETPQASIAPCERADAVQRQIAGRHAAEQTREGNPARQLMACDQDRGADDGDIFMHERSEKQAPCPGGQSRVQSQAPFEKLGYAHVRSTLRAMIPQAYAQGS
jgi:hypothetical protein